MRTAGETETGPLLLLLLLLILILLGERPRPTTSSCGSRQRDEPRGASARFSAGRSGSVYAAASVVYEERLVPHRGGVRQERGRLYAGEARLPIGGGTSTLKCHSCTPHSWEKTPREAFFSLPEMLLQHVFGFFQPQPSLPTKIVRLNGNTGLCHQLS